MVQSIQQVMEIPRLPFVFVVDVPVVRAVQSLRCCRGEDIRAPTVADAEKLRLTDSLLHAVLVEAQIVCIGQPMLTAGDLNADPAVIPCLAKGISAGRYVDLALAHSLGAGVAPDVTCRVSREDGTGTRRDFFVGCPGALAASQACYVTDR